ncbi:ankyrin repeat domain-containing protein [Luteimonas abyssi]|uniref:ankyrin repeat domain-containing protein n=1 Tax=Luteimonas abyssi TaxID=1247514 RepID=UPI000737BF36|nr:ankyrin repeat domain-containing protein [Luteimonas abyssi]
MTRTGLLIPLLCLAGACSGESMDPTTAFEGTSAAPLAQAIDQGEAIRIRELVAAGADPNAQAEDGLNPLQLAMLRQDKGALRALLAAGADPNRPGLGGATAMHGAAIANDPEYLDILLEYGGDPDARHAQTQATPLAGATGPRTDANFRRLLAAGADPGAADRTGNTPLHKAAMLNAGAQVLVLLEAGADPQARNSQEASFQAFFFRTPAERLTAEARQGREQVVAWLRAHDVPLEANATP